MKIAILLIFIALSAHSQTNLTFDILHTAQGDYTNASVTRSTPAFIVVSYDDGLAKVWMTNLPAFLKKKFGYNPTNAAAQLLADKERKKAEAAAYVARNKYLASLRGTNQIIRVVSVVDAALGECSISGGHASGTVYLMSAPSGAMDFFARQAELKNQISDLKTTPITITSRVNDPNDPDPAFTAQLNLDSALRQAKEERNDQISNLQDQLQELNESQMEQTTVRAYPTGLSRYGIPIWQCD